MEPTSTTLLDMLAAAGWSMYPLYACSFIGLVVFLKKTFEFWAHKVDRATVLADLPEVVEIRHTAALADRWNKEGSSLGKVLAVAAENLPDGAEPATREATRVAVSELDALESWIPVLSFVAQVAPLFGLLGTVLGMIDLFGAMEAAGAQVNTHMLAGGIWKALLTTAAGLLIAIPVMGGHMWLMRRLDILRHRMEEGVGRLIDRAMPVHTEAK